MTQRQGIENNSRQSSNEGLSRERARGSSRRSGVVTPRVPVKTPVERIQETPAETPGERIQETPAETPGERIQETRVERPREEPRSLNVQVFSD